jgi:hypothetical protein
MTASGVVLAHGIGTRTDLPIPRALALYGAAFVVAISFAALLLLWSRPRLGDGTSGRPLPGAVQRLVDAPLLRRALQAVVLALAVLVTAVALTGPAETTRNLAPWVLYVTFWVGLVAASLLLGPVWAVVNPLRLVHRGLVAITGPAPAADRLDRLGVWPAAASLLVFVWLELVYPDRAEPGTVGTFLVVHAAVQLVASLWFGERWFARGDGFEVYSTLVARLSPWGRRDDGRLVLRNPLTSLRLQPALPGLSAVVVVLLGSTAFDGITRTPFWQTGPGSDNGTLSGTLGLLASVAFVALVYVAATRASGILARLPPGRQPREYAHTLVPIALGYTVAHYFSLLLIDGQTTWILASNPFGTDGTDLFGTYGNRVDYAVVGPDAIAWVQVGAVVLGHVLGLVSAHEHALRAAPRARASDQLPLVLVMIVYTVVGLGLLFGF